MDQAIVALPNVAVPDAHGGGESHILTLLLKRSGPIDRDEGLAAYNTTVAVALIVRE